MFIHSGISLQKSSLGPRMRELKHVLMVHRVAATVWG